MRFEFSIMLKLRTQISKRIRFAGVILVCFCFQLIAVNGTLYAQDPSFSQFYSSPMFMAPSFAGAVKGSRLSLNYRDQWPSIPGTFVTYGAAYDHNFPDFNSGFGFFILRDVAGSSKLSLTNLGAAYSYNIKVSSEWNVRPGISFYYFQRSLDYSRLIFGDQLTSNPTPSTSVNPYPGKDKIQDVDASSSVLFYNSVFWGGATVDHLLKPNRAFTDNSDRVPMRIALYSGIRIVLQGPSRKLVQESLSFAFYYKQQDIFRQLDLGVYWYRMPLIVGVWYRGIPVFKEYPGSDAAIFLVGYKMNGIQIGYSYDATISKLGPQTGGAHEISFVYEFNITPKKRWGAVPCPEF